MFIIDEFNSMHINLHCIISGMTLFDYLSVSVKWPVQVRKIQYHGFSKSFQNTIEKMNCSRLYLILLILVNLTGSVKY